MRKSDIRRGDFVKIANSTWYEAVHRDGGIKLVGLKTSDTPECTVVLVCCDKLSDFVNHRGTLSSYQPKNIKCSAGGDRYVQA